MTANKDWILGEPLENPKSYTELYVEDPRGRPGLRLLAQAEQMDNPLASIAALADPSVPKTLVWPALVSTPGPWKRPPKETKE